MKLPMGRYCSCALVLVFVLSGLAACNLFVDDELAEPIEEDLGRDQPDDLAGGIEDLGDGSDDLEDEGSSGDAIEDVQADQDPCSACGSRECGAYGDCPSCGNCTGCESQCFGNTCGAAQQDHQDCSGGHPYWYDSCSVQGSRVDTCETYETCVDAGATASCRDSVEGDDCGSALECPGTAPICSTDGICQDGNMGDDCQSHDDCGAGFHCGGTSQCAVGDPLVLGETCVTDARCLSTNCSNDHCAPNGFAYIPPGTFCMGSPNGSTECLGETPPSELSRGSSETLHEVTLTRGFFLQETEVTQRQWEALGFTNPSSFDECGLDCPVEAVNWWEAVAYVNALSVSEGLEPCYTLLGDCDPSSAGTDIDCSGITVSDPGASENPYLCEGYRLPMEAEWEYAYRAGTRTAFYNGGITNINRSPLDEMLDLIGWYGGNSGVSYSPGYSCSGWYDGSTVCGTHEVGGKDPNEWGLYDMAGNVWEWVWDWYQSDYHASSPPSDPLGGTGSYRVLRGGSWSSNAQGCRAAVRDDYGPGGRSYALGFRPTRSNP